MIVYIDTSALARLYLGDRGDSAELARIVYSGDHPVVTSELTDVEVASACARASRDGVISADDADGLMDRYLADTADTGPVGIVALDSATLALAQRYVLTVSLRSLDAIHLATCVRFADVAVDEVQLLSREIRQNEAARSLGIDLA